MHVGDVFTQALRDNPELRVIAVVPFYPDLEGAVGRTPHLLGRRRAMLAMMDAAPDRVAVYGIENDAGTPIYVHAKCCIVDDTWTSIGSDNFNRRSWTHDSELSAVVVDSEGEYARRLRLTLAAEHLGRGGDPGAAATASTPTRCTPSSSGRPPALDDWYAGGQAGPRPPGRLRRLQPPELPRLKRALALPLYLRMHDPDGRPGTAAEEGRVLSGSGLVTGPPPRCLSRSMSLSESARLASSRPRRCGHRRCRRPRRPGARLGQARQDRLSVHPRRGQR